MVVVALSRASRRVLCSHYPPTTPQDATALYTRNLAPAAVAGLPALIVPCGLSKPRQGAAPGTVESLRLPCALEFVGADGDDERLLELGAAFQALAPLLPDPVVVAHWQSAATLVTLV